MTCDCTVTLIASDAKREIQGKDKYNQWFRSFSWPFRSVRRVQRQYHQLWSKWFGFLLGVANSFSNCQTIKAHKSMPPKRKALFNPEEAKEYSKKAKIRKDSFKIYEEAEWNFLSVSYFSHFRLAGYSYLTVTFTKLLQDTFLVNHKENCIWLPHWG